ncbi:23S rRNA (adenine(2503)-C(2))-methyltransferase RlmN [Vallitalea okinawensis]|uniref:23S rRNA (adenine(2503)-C(2))-methyltransferase RlmN n=1 Tax=Vallitalea okinawensis TaxID=2078660 RepID=UPI000CFAAC42|nr:23S rRNA (adenine(2503)-C(2))-methyltransferase RlmN [Vallitalea okinawensis]
MKQEINALNMEELELALIELNEKKFRAKQIFKWLHEKMVTNFGDMSNLSKSLIDKLDENFYITSMNVLERLESKDQTIKYLFQLHDHHIIETVLMKYKHGYSICISSQVGCRMGCNFCASTIDGLERNLTSGEMLAQIYTIQREKDIKIRNVVVMGSGEPLENLDHLLRFIELINIPEGQNIGQRNITVSTCGLAEQIRKLAKANLQITLAVSLHAPYDDIRQSMMPINRKYSIQTLFDACDYYTQSTNRRITYEYALIRGVNDTDACANELARLLKHRLSHINLIPVNDVIEREYEKSSEVRIQAFAGQLEKKGINVTIRRELGSDINAACGQLRKSYQDKEK